MANFSNVIITEEGKKLLAKVEAEKDILSFTQIKTSNVVYKKENLYSLVDIDNPKQIKPINTVTYEAPNKIKVEARLTNGGLDEGYNLACYGVYGKSKKYTKEILIAAACVEDINEADWISPSGSLNIITINLNTYLLVSNIEIESVNVSDDGVSTETFNNHVNMKGESSVHGATYQAEPGMIIARDGNGAAEIEYPTKPTEKSIVNKKALDTALSNLNIDAGVPQEAVINYYMPNAIYKVGDVVAIETTLAERVPTVKPTEPEPEPEQPTPEQPTNPDDKKEEAGGNTGDSGNSGTETPEPTEPENPSGDTERVKVVSIGDTIQVGAAIYEAIDNVYEDEGFTDIKTNPTKYPDIWQFKRWAI